jgi:hypothetical protein
MGLDPQSIAALQTTRQQRPDDLLWTGACGFNLLLAFGRDGTQLNEGRGKLIKQLLQLVKIGAGGGTWGGATRATSSGDPDGCGWVHSLYSNRLSGHIHPQS